MFSALRLMTALALASSLADTALATFDKSLLPDIWPVKTCNVKALGNGKDDGPNILSAFSRCSTNAVIAFPDSHYTVGTALNTSGLHNVEIDLKGTTIQYTDNITYWSPASFFLTYQNATTAWLLSGHNILLHGPGTINGSGQTWWTYFAENPNAGIAGGSSRTFARPVPLTIFNSTNALVQDLTIVDSPFWHNFVVGSTNVAYDGITLRSVSSNASAPAVNTDGWDIYRTSHISITNSHIVNGDDCVSFKPNTTYAYVANLYCNGSHGVSVGSLGQYAGETDIVANVLVESISMNNAQNGARIKVFGGSSDPNSVSGGGTGFVQNVTYKNFQVSNVDAPIVLTQCYETSDAQCEAFPATLTINDVHFVNVTGSASGKDQTTVVSLECSNPCNHITALGTKLTNPDGPNVYQCANLVDESTLDFPCTNVTGL